MTDVQTKKEKKKLTNGGGEVTIVDEPPQVPHRGIPGPNFSHDFVVLQKVHSQSLSF